MKYYHNWNECVNEQLSFFAYFQYLEPKPNQFLWCFCRAHRPVQMFSHQMSNHPRSLSTQWYHSVKHFPVQLDFRWQWVPAIFSYGFSFDRPKGSEMIHCSLLLDDTNSVFVEATWRDVQQMRQHFDQIKLCYFCHLFFKRIFRIQFSDRQNRLKYFFCLILASLIENETWFLHIQHIFLARRYFQFYIAHKWLCMLFKRFQFKNITVSEDCSHVSFSYE